MPLIMGEITVKNVIYKGTQVDRIIYNGVEVFRRMLNVFKDGVLDSGSELSGFSIRGTELFRGTGNAGEDETLTASSGVSMDMTDYTTLKVRGRYKTYANYGSCYIRYGVDSAGTSLTSQANKTADFNLEIDVTEYTGEHTFRVSLSATNKSSEPTYMSYSNIWIDTITLE